MHSPQLLSTSRNRPSGIAADDSSMASASRNSCSFLQRFSRDAASMGPSPLAPLLPPPPPPLPEPGKLTPPTLLPPDTGPNFLTIFSSTSLYRSTCVSAASSSSLFLSGLLGLDGRKKRKPGRN